MTNPEPVATRNLDQYDQDKLPWSTIAARLDATTTASQDVFPVLSTVTPDCRPHATGVGAMWIDGAWYFVSGPGTRKSRNLAANPACSLTARLPGLDMELDGKSQRVGVDVVFEGEAQRVTDPQELERVASVYRTNGGWPVQVEGDAFTAPFTAPSGGPPPWNLYRLDAARAFAVGSIEEFNGATKYTFAG